TAWPTRPAAPVTRTRGKSTGMAEATPGADGAPSAGPSEAAAARGLRLQEVRDLGERGTRLEHAVHGAGGDERGHVLVRDRPAGDEHHVGEAGLVHQRAEPREDGAVG